MIQRLTRNKTILAIASIVIGVFMMIRRGSMVADLLRIVGYLLIAAGAAYVIYYFIGKNREGVRHRVTAQEVCDPLPLGEAAQDSSLCLWSIS